jgi:hypothetical protein
VAEPVFPDAGVTLTVRLEPLPPRKIPEAGNRVVLEELAVTARSSAAVVESPTVKPSTTEEVLIARVWLPIEEIVGAALSSTAVKITSLENSLSRPAAS